MTFEKAETLARQIRDYWRARGYFGISAAAVPVAGHFGVSSNIGPNGYPPKELPRQVRRAA